MIPVGYMAKRVVERPEFLNAPGVADIYSVACLNEDFADYITYWKHNGYWFFDEPRIISDLARENEINLRGTKLFFYKVHEQEHHADGWHSFGPLEGLREVAVVPPAKMNLEGFDVVTFWAKGAPEHSPLSCNGLAAEIATNEHCLLGSFEEAKAAIERGKFSQGEPGPHRIFAVYSVDEPWPPTHPQ